MAAGSGDTGESKQVGPIKASGTGNVVRFPGNWFGSKDDLIPFGPSAERIRAERAGRAAEVSAPRDHSHAEPGGGVSATDFWGGGSGVFPPATAERAPAGLMAPERPRGLVGAAAPRRRKLGPFDSFADVRKRMVRPRADLTIFTAALAAVMVIGACLAFVLSHSGATTKPKQTASTRAGAGHRPASASTTHSIVQGHPVAIGPLRTLGVKHHRERAAPHQPAAVHRRNTHRTAPDGTAGSGGGTGSTEDTPSDSSPVDGGDGASAGDVPASTGSGGGTGSSSAGTGSSSDGTGSSSAGTGGSSSAGTGGSSAGTGSATHSTGVSSNRGATGPAGLGGTVGESCNPVCR